MATGLPLLFPESHPLPLPEARARTVVNRVPILFTRPRVALRESCYSSSWVDFPILRDCTASALITGSLTPSVIGDRPSHPISKARLWRIKGAKLCKCLSATVEEKHLLIQPGFVRYASESTRSRTNDVSCGGLGRSVRGVSNHGITLALAKSMQNVLWQIRRAHRLERKSVYEYFF